MHRQTAHQAPTQNTNQSHSPYMINAEDNSNQFYQRLNHQENSNLQEYIDKNQILNNSNNNINNYHSSATNLSATNTNQIHQQSTILSASPGSKSPVAILSQQQYHSSLTGHSGNDPSSQSASTSSGNRRQIVPASLLRTRNRSHEDEAQIQMTRTPYASASMASAQNPYEPATATVPASSKLDYTGYSGTPIAHSGASSSGGGGSNQRISKTHAHSTSLLANDSYMAGMSSDSELTSATRHHHRPYSSQSRVYHAHPAHRSPHASSRLSHYSDSAATYASNEPASMVGVTHQANQQQPPPTPSQQQQQQQQQSHAHHVHLAHQGSVSSSGSNGGGGASGAYLTSLTAGDSPLLQQPGASVIPRPGSGRQLPQQQSQNRQPFKQSMSIDHHSIGHQYHHAMGPHLSSPVHSMSPHFEPSDYQSQTTQQAYTSGGGPVLGLGQRTVAPHLQQGGSQLHHSLTLHTEQRYGQRDFRHDMDMLDKQTANMNLYDNDSGLPSTGLPPTTSRPTSVRQLPPINAAAAAAAAASANIGSISADHLHHQVEPYRSSSSQAELQQQPQPQQKLHHTQQDLYASHQMMSSPADWLPPMGITSHHLNRASGAQFKQAMSIDHCPTAGQQQQRQHSHYLPSRAAHLGEHYHHASIGYSSNTPSASVQTIGSYESPAHQLSGYQSAMNPDHQQHHHGDIMYQCAPQEQQQLQKAHYSSTPSGVQEMSLQQQAHLPQKLPNDSNPHSSSSLTSYGPMQAAPSSKRPGGQLQQSNLQHQISSSSSNNSQSGSLRSSNLDINKSLTDHQKAATLSHYQHQQSPQHVKGNYDQEHKHGLLRKGYTSVAPGSSAAGFNETVDLSSSQSTTASHSGTAHLASHGGMRPALRAASPSVTHEATTSSSSSQQQQPHHHHHHHHHHHSSPYRDGGGGGTRSESSTGLPNDASSSSSLTKKSNSATQLSMTGTKKRLGFRKKQITSFSVHRSEEVAPLEARHLVKQGSSVSEGDSSMSGDSSSRSWSNSNFKPQTSEELASMSFIDGLGKGQMISRQGLASPYLGDIQLSLCDRRGNLEIEVIRARNLQAKSNKILPLTYVKLYLVKNRKCLAKAKTTLSNKRTLDPLFQQQLTFHEDYHGCILQSIIWGNFGKMDKKNFMGIAQISIDDLELSDTVISWYKLFLPSSLQTLPSKSLRHTLLSNSTESFTNTNNS